MWGGRRSVWAAVVVLASARARAATVTWTGGVDGNWSTPGNWDVGVPNSGDDAVITLDGTYTVTLDVDTTVASLTLGGSTGTQTLLLASHSLELDGASAIGATAVLDMNSGVLTAMAPLTVTGVFDWAGGTVQGAIAIGASGSLLVNGSAPKLLQGGSPATDIANAGTATWTGTGSFTITNGATFTNQATGIFRVQTDASLTGTATFSNAGQFVKNGMVSTTLVSVTSFVNTGSVQVQTGILRFPNAVTSSGVNGFDAASGTEVTFQSTAAFTDTTFSGTGAHRITGTSTVTVAGTITTSNLEFAGDASLGNLIATAPVSLVGTLNWTSGIIQGDVTVPAASTLAISGVAAKTLTGVSSAIHNAGTTTWSGNGVLNVSSGATFENQTGGLFSVQTDAALQGGATFLNAGTFAKSSSTGPTQVQLALFANTGSISVQSGILRFPTTITSTGAGNTIDAATGTQVLFQADATFAGTTFSGVGVHKIQTSNGIAMSGVIGTTNLEFAGDVNVGGIVANPPVTISGTLSWTSGIIQGSLTVPSGSALALSTAATKTLDGSGPATVLTNAGTITFGGTGTFRVVNGSSIANLAGGAFNATTDATFTGDGTFTNAGTFAKTGAGGPTAVQLGGFTNTGTVQVTSGTVQFPGLVTSSGVGNTFDAATGTQIAFVADASLTDTTMSGAGLHRIQGTGNVTLAGTITSSNFDFAGDPATGGIVANPQVTINGNLGWASGIVQGTLTIPAGSTLSLSGVGTKTLKGGTYTTSIANAGTTTWTGNGTLSVVNGATVTNQPTGTIVLQGDGTLGGTGTLANAGTFTKNIATGTSQVQLAFANTGTLSMQSGALSFTTGYVQTAGSTVLMGGNLAGPALIDIQGGTFTGAGTITGPFRNAAAFRPGNSGPGLLTIMGAFTQASPGGFNVEIGGTGAGTTYDQVTSQGMASLTGALDVTLVDGFTPTPGQVFTILTYGSHTGDFATTSGLVIGNGLGFKKLVGATDVRLNVVQEICCNLMDDDGDGLTDLADPKCAGATCSTTTTTSTSTTIPGGTSTTTTTIPQCADGVDDDGDQLVDCADPGCAGDPLCAAPGAEICGNCIDDDGNGQTDFEDPVCCQGSPSSGLAIKQGRLVPGTSTTRVTLRAVLGAGGVPAVNPLLQDVYVQIRPESGVDVLCAQIPASQFGRKGRRFTFFDPAHSITSAHAIDRLTLTIRNDGKFVVRLTGKQVDLGLPDDDKLWLTLGFHDTVETEQGNRCESTSQTFKRNAKGVRHYP